MNGNKSAPEGRKGNKPVTTVAKSTTESRTSRLMRRRRRRRWLSGVATGVFVGVLTGVVTGGFSVAVHAANGLLFPVHPRSTGTPHAMKSIKAPTTRSGGGVPAVHKHSPICQLELVSEYSLDSWEVRAWIFPRQFRPTPSQLAELNEDRSSADIMNRDLYNDGGFAPFTYTQFILHNTCSQSATITDIRASKICHLPLDGTIFVGQPKLNKPGLASMSTQRVSNLDPPDSTQLAFNLDSPDPEAMIVNGWNTSLWTQQYASGPLITVQGNGRYAIDIRSIALYSSCSFSIKVRILYNNRIYIQTFDDGGQPFRVSALLPGVLSPKGPEAHPFAGYEMLYAGWNASPWHDGTWTREDPKTWHLAK